MLEFLQSLDIDWMTLLGAIWTIVLVPIGNHILELLKAKKLDGYATILYEEVVKAVKSIQEVYVKDLKGTGEWTSEKQEEIKELAKDKAIQALSSIAYKTLKEANEDFDEYLDGLIGSALWDIKNGVK